MGAKGGATGGGILGLLIGGATGAIFGPPGIAAGIATGGGLGAGAGAGVAKAAEALEPEVPELKLPGTVDEEAARARKREIDRARATGRNANILTKLGGAGTQGFSVARTALTGSVEGGQTLG